MLHIPRSTWAQARPDALSSKQEQFVHLSNKTTLVEPCSMLREFQLYQDLVARYHDDG